MRAQYCTCTEKIYLLFYTALLNIEAKRLLKPIYTYIYMDDDAQIYIILSCIQKDTNERIE